MRKKDTKCQVGTGGERSRVQALRSREARKQRRDLRQNCKRVYRLKNGLLSLNRTPSHLIPIAQNNSLSPLLRLPAEIRTKIWEHALGGMRILCSTCIGTYFRAETSEDANHAKIHPQQQLALLQVCRQIYNETATLTFSTNLFCFSGRTALEEVWKRMRPAQRDAVKRMVVDRPLMLHYLQPKPKVKPLFTNPCAPFASLKTMVVESRSLMENQGKVEPFLDLVEQVRIAQGINVVLEQGTKDTCVLSSPPVYEKRSQGTRSS